MSNVQPPRTAGDFAAFAELRAQAGTNANGTAREAARQFEALFTQMMLKSMRAAGDVFSDGSDTNYRDMFDQQIAMELSKGRGLGLADMLTRQLDGNATPTTASGPRPIVKAAAATSSQANSATVTLLQVPRITSAPPDSSIPELDSTTEASSDNTTRQDWHPAGPLEFLRDLAPYAEKAATQLGVSARAILAQAALETGWGQNVVRDSQGVSSNNLFNIKAGAQWVGDQIHAKTLEVIQGVTERKTASFRAYPNLGAAFSDYVKMIGANPRYAGALQTGGDPTQFANSLQKAGYATDPSYADKLRSIMTSSRFEGAISQLKKLGHLPTSF